MSDTDSSFLSKPEFSKLRSIFWPVHKYELKKFILFDHNVNKFTLDFDNSVEYLNSLPNDNDKLYEELKDYINKNK